MALLKKDRTALELKALRIENEELKLRLAEAAATLMAIQDGKVQQELKTINENLDAMVLKRTEELGESDIFHGNEVINRRLAEQIAKENEEQTLLLIQQSSSIIYEIDFTTSKFVTVNDGMCKKLGYSKEELLSMDIRTYYYVNAFRLGEPDSRKVAVVFKDITEQKKSENLLRESEERYRAVFENSIDGIIISYPDGGVEAANSEACKMFGMTEQELIQGGRNAVVDLTDPRLGPALEERKRTGHFRGELNLKRKDGSIFPVDESTVIFTDKNGQQKTIMIIRDITDRKKAEEVLQKYRAKLDAAIASMTDAVYITDMEGNIIEINNAYASFYKFKSKDECLRTFASFSDILDVSYPDGSVVPTEMWSTIRALRGETGTNRELHIRRKDTGEIWVGSFNFSPMRDHENNIIGSVVVARDITELKDAENALRQSEEKYRSLFETIIEGFCIIELVFDKEDKPIDYRFLEINPSFEMQTGLVNAQGKLMRDLAPDHEQHWFDIYGEVALTGVFQQFENEAKALGRFFNVHAYKLGGPESRKVAILLSDITLHKQAQKALVESEERVRFKLQSILSPEGSIADLKLEDIIDTQSIQKLMNNFYELAQIPMAIIDVKGKVLVEMGWQNICTKFHRVHPESCKNCIESDVFLTRDIPEGEFKLYKCKNNMWDMATPLIIGGEHKGNLFLGQFFFDSEPIEYQLFREQADQYDFAEQEYLEQLDKVPRLSLQKIDHAKAFFMNLSRSISQLSYSNIKLARAISQQKIVEESLRENEELLNKAQQIAQLGFWSLDLITNQLTWSNEIYHLFGLQAHEFSATYEGFLDAIHPQDRDAVNSAYVNSILKGNDSYEIEHRIVLRHTGEIRHVYEKCEHLRDDSGKIVRSVGMVHDITERKVKEEALRKLNQTLAILSKSSQAMVYSVDEIKYMEQVCSIVVEDCGFAMAWIGFADKDAEKTVKPMAHAGFEDGYLETLNISWADMEWGQGPAGTAIRTGNMSMCNNMLTDPSFEPYREQSLKLGYASSVVFPLIAEDKAFGVINIYSNKTEAFGMDEIKLLYEIVNDLSHGIISIRLKAEKEWSEEVLHRSHDALEDIVKDRNKSLQATNDLLKNEIIISRQQDRSLIKAEEKYRTVANFTYNWETWMNPKGEFIYVSPSCLRITGYTTEEFIHDPALFFMIIHPEDREMFVEHFNEEQQDDLTLWTLDYRIHTREGEERWIGHHSQLVYDAKGNFLGQRGSSRDITQQKRAEKVLIDSQNHLRELTQRMDAVAEAERKHIAQEIHDELGHLLTALKYDMDGLFNNSELSMEEVKSEMDSMISMVDSLIDSVRKIATDLRPGILDHLGLIAALEWKINNFKLRTRMQVHYEQYDICFNFNKNETIIIYRIVQEVLTNVVRHSKANELWVTVFVEDNDFVLKIKDDGIGFSTRGQHQKGSLGLMGMRERALSIGGKIQIESALNKGTTVTFLLRKK